LSTNGKPVAMALLRAGHRQMHNLVTVHDGGRVVNHARVGAVAFECIVTLSYADFLLSWLDDAAFEFGAAT